MLVADLQSLQMDQSWGCVKVFLLAVQDMHAMGQGVDLHLDNLLVEVDAAIVHHLHHPFFLAGWADLGLVNVPQDVLHQLLVLTAVTLEAGMAATREIKLAQEKFPRYILKMSQPPNPAVSALYLWQCLVFFKD